MRELGSLFTKHYLPNKFPGSVQETSSEKEEKNVICAKRKFSLNIKPAACEMKHTRTQGKALLSTKLKRAIREFLNSSWAPPQA